MKATDWDKHWATVSRSSALESWRLRSVWKGYRTLLRDVDLPADPRILELGAGSGHISMQLIRQYGGTAVLVESNKQAVDFSRELWTEAGMANLVRHFHGSIFDFDSSERFDIVHSGGVVEHFHGEDRKRIVEAHVNAVRPQGKIVVVVPVQGWRYRGFRLLLKLLGKWIYADEVPWTREDAAAEFGRYGYKVTQECIIGHEVGYLIEKDIA